MAIEESGLFHLDFPKIEVALPRPGQYIRDGHQEEARHHCLHALSAQKDQGEDAQRIHLTISLTLVPVTEFAGLWRKWMYC
jgi:hypothetical protein